MPDPVPSADGGPAAIQHTIRIDAPESHYVDVVSTFPTAGSDALELSMAVWTPGSYLIREYARHVEGITAADPGGAPLSIAKTRKNRWRIATAWRESVVVRYRLYARELSVRTNYVDADFALLSGAATFLVPIDGHHLSAEVALDLPARWRTRVSPLAEVDATTLRAESYDELVDSPIYAGDAPIDRFVAAGREHVLASEGADERWDRQRAVADVARIVEATAAFWGTVPYRRYAFLNLLTEGGGGLEHRDASVLMASRLRTRTPEGWVDWLGLVAHELFHAWHAKRLRPIEFDRFNYEGEVYTPSLWIVEGFTTYYEDLLLRRAGFIGPEELLARLSKTIESVESAPGHLVQGLDVASFDAWIKYYRKDENFANSGVSYYSKGAVVAFLLDARIRHDTGGRRSLDDAMRLAWSRYSGARGFRHEEMLALFDEVAGQPLGGWIEAALRPGPIDLSPLVLAFGLRFAGDARLSDAHPWIGIEVEVVEGRTIVSHVVRGGPAATAGVATGDEILALDDDRVPSDGLAERLRGHRVGEPVELLVARRERLRRLPLVLGARPRPRGRLAPDPDATPEQRARLLEWLDGGRAASLSEAAHRASTALGPGAAGEPERSPRLREEAARR